MRIFCLILALATAPVAVAFELGDTVPDFSLPALDGGQGSLHAYLDDIVVLNFFATWCPGCNDEATELERDVWQVYRDRGVTVLAVDIQEAAPLVQGWSAALGVTYPILLAPDWDLFLEFPQALGLPYNAVLDREMTLRYALPGFDRPGIVAMVETILAEDQVADEATAWGAVKSLYR